MWLITDLWDDVFMSLFLLSVLDAMIILDKDKRELVNFKHLSLADLKAANKTPLKHLCTTSFNIWSSIKSSEKWCTGLFLECRIYVKYVPIFLLMMRPICCYNDFSITFMTKPCPIYKWLRHSNMKLTSVMPLAIQTNPMICGGFWLREVLAQH